MMPSPRETSHRHAENMELCKFGEKQILKYTQSDAIEANREQ